jgi:hypothetical protein
MSSVFNSGALKIHHRGQTSFFQTDLQRSHLSIPKPISWNQVFLSEEWLLQDAISVPKSENTVVSQIQLFSTRSVSISFQRSFSQRISTPSVRTEPESRHAVSSFPTRLEAVNFETSIPQPKYTVESAPTTKAHSDPSQSPTYSSLGNELNVLSESFQIDKETLQKDFYSPKNLSKMIWFFETFQDLKR